MLEGKKGVLLSLLIAFILASCISLYINKQVEVSGKISMKGKTDKTYHLSLKRQTDLELDSVTYYTYYKMKSNREHLYTKGPDYYFYINDEDVKVSKEDYYKYKIGSNYSNK